MNSILVEKCNTQKIPIIIVVGNNDMQNDTIAINFSDGRNEQDITKKEGLRIINDYLKVPKLKI